MGRACDGAAGVARVEGRPVQGHGWRPEHAARRFTRVHKAHALSFSALLAHCWLWATHRLMGPLVTERERMGAGAGQCGTLRLPRRHELPTVRPARQRPRRAAPLRVLRGVVRQERQRVNSVPASLSTPRPKGAPQTASRQGCPLNEMLPLLTSRNAPPEELKPLGPVIHT